MTVTIDLTTEEQARLEAAARQRGVGPGECVRQIVVQHLARESGTPQSVDPQNAASIALLESWLAEEATDDPEATRHAEEELAAFKEVMNEPRRAAGARILYP